MGKKAVKKRDSFPFKYKDWLTSAAVRGMEKHNRADYMDLLCYVAAEDGKGLKDDDKANMKLLHCTSEDWDIIKQKFNVIDGRLFNKKLSELMAEEPAKEKKKPLNIFEMPEGLSLDKQIKFKKDKVKEDLKKFVAENSDKSYTSDMLNDFYLYWTAPTHDKTQIKMEREDTWDYEGRLHRWYKREKINGTPNGQSKAGKLLDANSKASEMMKNLNTNGTGTKQQAKLH